MSRIDQLIDSYFDFISIPWRNAAPDQRVVFCIYNQMEELKLRLKVEEFELATKQAKHGWEVLDLNETFAEWLSEDDYAEEFFNNPGDLMDLLPDEYLSFIIGKFKKWQEKSDIHVNTVVAIKGIGSLFGFIKIKDLVDEISKLVPGRLLIFFPGSYENNNYRLLDAYDGWNYLAVPITPDKEF